MDKEIVVVDPDRCVACGACAAVCPHRLFALRTGEPPRPSPDADAACIRCGHCIAVCPREALRHRELDPDDFPPTPDPPDFKTALGFLRARRSVRGYEPRPVDEETVRQVLQGARYAPTGHNDLEVACTVVLGDAAVAALRERLIRFYRRFVAVVSHPLGRFAAALVFGRGRVGEIQNALPGFRRAAQRVAEGGDPLFHGAPVLLLFHAPKGKETSEVDCALAAGQVTLLAPSLGLGTCHIGYASAALKRIPWLARAAGVPAGRAAFVVLTLGYPSVFYPRLVPRPPLEAGVVR